MVNITPSFWDQENKGQDWGQHGTVGQHAKQEATTWALVRPGEAGAFLSLSLPSCKFMIRCPSHRVGGTHCSMNVYLAPTLCQAVGWAFGGAVFAVLVCTGPASRVCGHHSHMGTHAQEGPVLGLNPHVLLSPFGILNF